MDIQQIKTVIDDKLLNLLKEEFDTDDQKLFIESFKSYLQYEDNDKAFIINLEDILDWLGFTRKDNAKVLLKNNFKENIDFIEKYDDKTAPVNSGAISNDINDDKKIINKKNGGQNKQNIYMNVDTFKEFCILAQTKKAKQVRQYYIKMEKVLFKYMKQSIEDKDNKMLTITNEFNNQVILLTEKAKRDRHNALVNSNDCKNLVYAILIINYENNSFIIKIGWSNNLKGRIDKINYNFKVKCILLDVFLCLDNINFEKKVHEHFNYLKYKKPINGYNSTEVFLVENMYTYNKIKQYMNKKVTKFQVRDEKETKLQIEYLNADSTKQKNINESQLIEIYKDEPDNLLLALNNKHENNNYEEENLIKTLMEQNKTLIEQNKILINKNKQVNIIVDNQVEINDINNVVNNDIINNIIDNQVEINNNNVNKNNTYGPKVQIYLPNELNIVHKVFDGLTDATRNIKYTNVTHIKNAVKHKKVYMGYRWHLIDRNILEFDKAQDIGETQGEGNRLMDFVVMLNNEKTKILNMFSTQREAATFVGCVESGLTKAVKYGNLLNDKYFMLWNNVSDDLQIEYMKNNELPPRYKNFKSYEIQKINPETNEIISYTSLAEACKEEKISVRVIKKYSTSDTIYKNFKWKIIK